MVYPLFTFIKYIFGDRIAATNLLSNITPKRMIGYHLINIILAAVFALLTSKVIVDLIKIDDAYTSISEYIAINTLNMFNSYLPILIFSYVLFIIFLSILSIIYFIIAKAFKSKVTLRTTIYSLQFLGILHVFVHLFSFLILFSNTIGIGSVIIYLTMIGAIILFFTISKQYAQISSLTTITMILLNLIIAGIIILLMMSSVGSTPI